MNGTVTRDEFKQLPTDHKLVIIYDTLKTRDDECTKRCAECVVRFEKLEKRKWFDKGIAIASGALAGLLGALGIKIS